jgi:hypothetical protein
VPAAALATAVALAGVAMLLAARPRDARPAAATDFLRNTEPTGTRVALLRYAPLGTEVERVAHAVTAHGGACRSHGAGEASTTVCLAPPVVRDGMLTALRIELEAAGERLRGVRVCHARLVSSEAVGMSGGSVSCGAEAPPRVCEASARAETAGCAALTGVVPGRTDGMWTVSTEAGAVLWVGTRQWAVRL